MTITVRRNKKRQLERTAEAPRPPPSRGGNAYSMDSRYVMATHYITGEHRRDVNQQLQQMGRSCHPRTARRWIARYNQLGHMRPFCPNGNKRSAILHGLPELLLVLFRCVHPSAMAKEVRAFLWNTYSSNLAVPRWFLDSEISRCQYSLELTRKRCSVSARQASLPRNILKRWIFWNMAYPDGCADVPAWMMIDIDEMAIEIATAARHYGTGAKGQGVQIKGPYGREGKLTVLMAAFATPTQNGVDRFVDMEERPGTGVFEFYRFIDNIINLIGPGTIPGNQRCFTMDNLTAHKHPMVLQRIIMSGHRYLFRAPYYPVDGPIEYVFDTIENDLRARMYRILCLEDAKNETLAIINSIDGFANYFRHCGFTN